MKALGYWLLCIVVASIFGLVAGTRCYTRNRDAEEAAGVALLMVVIMSILSGLTILGIRMIR